MINFRKKPEILAPCGSYDILVAAIAAGADACYIGGNKYGARAYATNFDTDSIVRAIDYAHLHDAKLYLTINTLFKQNEISDLFNYIKPYYEAGLDAVIVQDLGVFYVVKELFPDISIHCSTQMNINSVHGARLMYEHGAHRIVTAREMSLSEIKTIKDEIPQLELEAFVHGAMCYSYSGQCLMSSFAGGRSGNRGRCAQPCRKCYGKDYILSMKDMCSLENIPAIIDGGIDSLKIEGRMKNSYYVASAVDAYRTMRDMYLNGIFSIKEAEKAKKRLANVYNRGGFCDGYFFMHNGPEMISSTRPNNQGVKTGYLKQINNGSIDIKLCENLYRGDVLELKTNKNEIIEITSGIDGKCGNVVRLNAPKTKYLQKNQDIYRTKCQYILDETHRQFLCDKAADRIKLPLSFKMFAKIGEPFKAIVSCRNNGRVFSAEYIYGKVEACKNQTTDVQNIIQKISQLGNTDYYFEDINISVDNNAFIPLGVIKQLRRSSIDMLEAEIIDSYRRSITPSGNKCTSPDRQDIKIVNELIMSSEDVTVDKKQIILSEDTAVYPEIKIHISDMTQLKAVMKYTNDVKLYGIYMSRRLYDEAQKSGYTDALKMNGIKIYLELPYIIDSDFNLMAYLPKDSISGIYIRNIDGLATIHDFFSNLELDFICAYSLYAYNTYARRFIADLLKDRIIFELPRELNLKELSASFGMNVKSINEFMIYGHQQVMLSAQCVQKNSDGCDHAYNTLKITDDKGNSFFAKCFCDGCFNVIYNNAATCMFNKLYEIKQLINPVYFQLELTIEDEKETVKIMEMLVNAVNNKDTSMINLSGNMYTNGHNYRGVE